MFSTRDLTRRLSGSWVLLKDNTGREVGIVCVRECATSNSQLLVTGKLYTEGRLQGGGAWSMEDFQIHLDHPLLTYRDVDRCAVYFGRYPNRGWVRGLNFQNYRTDVKSPNKSFTKDTLSYHAWHPSYSNIGPLLAELKAKRRYSGALSNEVAVIRTMAVKYPLVEVHGTIVGVLPTFSRTIEPTVGGIEAFRKDLENVGITL